MGTAHSAGCAKDVINLIPRPDVCVFSISIMFTDPIPWFFEDTGRRPSGNSELNIVSTVMKAVVMVSDGKGVGEEIMVMVTTTKR